jgi:hypothetical protein
MRLLISAFILFLAVACVEPYAPPSVRNAPHLLVVDGFLNASENEIMVRLSQTVALDDNNPPPVISNANVILQDEDGLDLLLTEVAAGEYAATGLNINAESKYRLRIFTGTKSYVSDYVPITQTPEIEEIGIEPNEDELEFNVSTSDPTGKSKFYRWKYTETFEYTVPYSSEWKLENGQAVPRSGNESIYRCYKSGNSTGILVSTSTSLTADKITDFLIAKIPRSSIKLMKRYSINVEQQVLTADAYAYWLNLYKTTEDVGGLFDPLPGQVNGNIRNENDPDEVVVGFFGAGNVTKKQIFVTEDDLHPYCQLDTILVEFIPQLPSSTLLYSAIYSPSGLAIVAFTSGSSNCLDCRSYGGVTTKPDFWP